jgi:hypothetical protein
MDVRRRFGNSFSVGIKVLKPVCNQLAVSAENLASDLGIPTYRVRDIAQKLGELGLVALLPREGEPWLLPTKAGRRFYRRYLSNKQYLVIAHASSGKPTKISIKTDLTKKDPATLAARRFSEILRTYERPRYYG